MSEKKAIHKFKAGDVFDERYILEKLMGSGGFADVWKAKDKDTNSSIALKIYTNLDDDGINDLASEYTRMQNLNHTNILKADYFARWGNIPYLVMKVCEGGSLSKKVGCIDDTELMHVIQDIAEGLTYLHQNKIVHQDIKPANILVDTRGDKPIYVLSDFGISSKTKTRLSHSVNINHCCPVYKSSGLKRLGYSQSSVSSVGTALLNKSFKGVLSVRNRPTFFEIVCSD